MPGFNLGGVGGGYSAAGPSFTTETRRKHRWVFVSLGRGQGTFAQEELLLLQSASRPSFKFEEPEMHHNQEVARFAGKQDWEPITLVWYDAEQNPDVSRGLYLWIESVVNMVSIQVNAPVNYKRSGELAMINGAGATTEQWSLAGTWPSACNWQELDYTSTEIQTIEATMRFDRAFRRCFPVPAPTFIPPSCP